MDRGGSFWKPPPFVSMAISRILFSARSRARIDGHLSCPVLAFGTPALRRMRLLPGVGPACAGQGRRPVPPVLSCTAWGLSCALDCSRAGGLLPRLFTLAPCLRKGWFIFCRSALPRFRRACRLVVSGLSSPDSCEPGAAIRHRGEAYPEWRGVQGK